MKKLLYPLLLITVTIVFYLWEKKIDIKHYQSVVENAETTESHKNKFDYLPTSTTGAVIKHGYYTLSYSEKHEQAEWVAYQLKKEHLKYNDFKRPYFEIDPLVKTEAAHWKNYKKSGYDRGHLCPAADRKFDKKAYEETFLTSNISPQLNSFNAGIWNNLEKQVRYWAKKENEVYVVTGPIFENNNTAIGFENVTVPTHFYKIILKKGKKTKAIAFLLPHEASKKPLQHFTVSIDELEHKLGVDFFSAIPDDLEDKLERNVSTKEWQFISFR